MFRSNLGCDMRRILCGIDHSEPSLRAAKLAQELAAKYGAELMLLNVVPLLDSSQDEVAEYAQQEHNRNPPGVVIAEASETEVGLLGERLADHNNLSISHEVRSGAAAAEIISAARDNAIDLIVIGHCRHSRPIRLLLSSVAKKVIDAAPCPVLVVP